MLDRKLVSLFVAAVLVACSSSDDASSGGAAQTECDAPTDCASSLCLTLKPNLQNKAGICTSQCTDDTQCSGGKCVDISQLSPGTTTRICLASCALDRDCTNGFVCVGSESGNVCLARTADTPLPCTEDSQCTEAKAQCITGASGARACSHALDAADVFQRECTLETAGTCPGLACLTLKANAQKKSGICTMSCADDNDCPNAACVDAGTEKICLATCETDADCKNGYACTAEGGVSTRKVCLVTAL